MRQKISISEEQLRQIVTESVERVLNEGLFNRPITQANATKIWNQIAYYKGYKQVYFNNGVLCLKRNDGYVDKTNIPEPKMIRTGMLGTGEQAWSEKDVQNVTAQLKAWFQHQKQIRNQIAYEDNFSETSQQMDARWAREKAEHDRWTAADKAEIINNRTSKYHNPTY